MAAYFSILWLRVVTGKKTNNNLKKNKPKEGESVFGLESRFERELSTGMMVETSFSLFFFLFLFCKAISLVNIKMT